MLCVCMNVLQSETIELFMADSTPCTVALGLPCSEDNPVSYSMLAFVLLSTENVTFTLFTTFYERPNVN